MVDGQLERHDLLADRVQQVAGVQQRAGVEKTEGQSLQRWESATSTAVTSLHNTTWCSLPGFASQSVCRSATRSHRAAPLLRGPRVTKVLLLDDQISARTERTRR